MGVVSSAASSGAADYFRLSSTSESLDISGILLC